MDLAAENVVRNNNKHAIDLIGKKKDSVIDLLLISQSSRSLPCKQMSPLKLLVVFHFLNSSPTARSPPSSIPPRSHFPFVLLFSSSSSFFVDYLESVFRKSLCVKHSCSSSSFQK